MNINEISVFGNKLNGKDGLESQQTGLFPKETGRTGQITKEIFSGITDRITFGKDDSGNGNMVVNGYDLEEQRKECTDISLSQSRANENLAILSGEDCESMEADGSSLTESTREYVEHAVEKNKERKAWNAKKQEESLELRARMREEREKREAMGFAQLKSEAELRGALEEAGIPATQENLNRISAALNMSEQALEITDQTKYFMVSQELAPTVENLYEGRYTVYAEKEGVSQEFDGYREQIGDILQRIGLDNTEGWKNAEWLFSHELPVNADTIGQLGNLDRIAGEMTPSRVLDQLLFTMSAGLEPKEAVLDDQAFLAAQTALEKLQEISDEDIVRLSEAVVAQKKSTENDDIERENGASGFSFQKDENGEIVLNLAAFRKEKNEPAGKTDDFIPVLVSEEELGLEGLSADEYEERRLQVTLKRQLEEIRQKMTMQSAVSMERRGIHVETEPLEQVIRSLRQMENEYVAKQMDEVVVVTDEEFSLLQEALEKTQDISKSFAGVLGTGVRQQTLLTMNELHRAAGSANLSRREWMSTYETVQTQVRSDLGDSIQKAFSGVPSLLEGIGMEDTEANERAVRILGYNSMEITRENVEEVKVFDAKVNQVITNMKPSTVLELIRQGENPLNTPIDTLNRKLQKINAEKNITDEERYSRFLWQLEKNDQISEEERSGYIGIYRLLHQIEKSDGAAIGALLESDREVTLGNLLTQVRIRKSSGIDAAVDDMSGAREVVHTRESITDQIGKGFSGNTPGSGTGEQQGTSFGERKEEYYRQLVSDSLEEVSPSGLFEMTDGEIQQILNTSVEKFLEELKKSGGNPEIKKAYYEELAEEIRDGLKNTAAAEELLEKLSIPETIGNLLAANEILNGNENVYREIYSRKKVLDRQREKEFDDLVDEIPDVADSEEDLEKDCVQAEKIMQEVLTKSYESADIRFEDLQKLRQLGRGIRLEAAFRASKSYDIPIRTGDTVTSLNLTIIRGADETGKVQISMDDEIFGRMSLDFKVSGDLSVKGLVLCSERQGFETLRGQNEDLKKSVENAGFSVKNISYGMDFKSRNELLDESEQTETETAHLYRLAKVLVRQIAGIIK